MRPLLLTCLAMLFAGLLGQTAHAADQPNVILIFIDDMGWKDVGCYGNEFVDTPRIDQLAAEGMKFTDFYAAGAVCSPTRCAVQSGQNQARIGITDFIAGHWRPFEKVVTPRPRRALPLDCFTIGEAMQAAGYSTGYVGKWHLGNAAKFQPDQQGYDLSAVIGGPHLPGRYRVQGKSEYKPGKDQYRTDFEADICIDFIKKNKEEPFFLMLSPYAVHIPLGAMSAKVEKYRKRAEEQNIELPNPIYAAMIEHCDDMVGRIVDSVEELGLTDNTLIVFTSDNGGLISRYDYREAADDIVSDLSPLKGEKGSLHEGGIRVPLIVKYPPLVNAGSVTDEPAISYDFYPTFVDLAGGELPQNQTIDGLSLKPVLQDADAQLARSAIHWHYPHYHHDRPASAIRERDWKLIEYLDGSGDVELYQISEDIGETNNLAAEKNGRVWDLTKKLNIWREDVQAMMPLPNKGYDPERAHEWWNTRNNKPVDSDSRKRFPPTEKDL
ncbi:sulfatase [Rubinisphaera brasiliensis]|uniref:Cerebroside-sulfatase n=1 Tax=Rubinisphaera brasiliensis (strain ATCC 49424 / DSM 5305 / JCM 21570 / IAM 15109 / NBRC 103401 / IFAM 1448) TaxID=756272 RepID=F0SJP7_RUBBR|nr:sulfatase [Rubinisphaera brasiliensis]ADY61885.1 Cerebroside-sulfatase [Rubinisphaera brasiliensis DSM 5305]